MFRFQILLMAALAQTGTAFAYVPGTFGMGCHVHGSYPGHVVYIKSETATEIYWDHEIVINRYSCSKRMCIYRGEGRDKGTTIVMSFIEDLSKVELRISLTLNGKIFDPGPTEYAVTCDEG